MASKKIDAGTIMWIVCIIFGAGIAFGAINNLAQKQKQDRSKNTTEHEKITTDLDALAIIVYQQTKETAVIQNTVGFILEDTTEIKQSLKDLNK